MAEALLLEPKPASTDSVTYRTPPANVEAEQAILGALLVNNDELNNLGDNIRAEHFFEPVHVRIFEAIQKFHNRGMIANPVTLKHYFEQDESLADIGGSQYLVKLAASALHVINIRDFADTIYDLALKRSLITIGESIVNTAYKHEVDISANDQLEEAEQHLFKLSMEGMDEKGFKQLRFSVTEAITRAESAYRNSGRIVGVDTGLTDLNEMMGGLQRSDLIILAGRPSMGKTALATNVAYNAAVAFAEDASTVF